MTMRAHDDILAAAVKVVNRRFQSGRMRGGITEDNIEAFQTQLAACINSTREVRRITEGVLPPAQMKLQAGAYLKALRRVQRAAKAMRPRRSAEFLTALEHEIWEIGAVAACLKVPKGARQRDMVADWAAGVARSLLSPNHSSRYPENLGKDLPFIDCPWGQPTTLAAKGAWPVLASLIYEAATGIKGRDMLSVCRRVDEQSPRYVVEGPKLS